MNKIVALLLMLFCICRTVYAQAVEPFKKGERVVFVGNSITHGGHYHSYVWLYYMTHFPNRPITILNAGVGANSADQIYERLDEDVFARNPSTLYLTFGMNDVGYFEFLKPDADAIAKQKVSTTYTNFLKIADKLKAHPEVKKVLFSSSPYDETVKVKNNYFLGKSKAMLEVANFQEAIAKKNNWGYIDLNRLMTQVSLDEQKKDSLFTLNLNDRIHPSTEGHMVMAYFLLKAQGLAGKEIANVEIDAAKQKVQQAANCKVSKVSFSPKGLEFNYLANSLPYPIDTVARLNGTKSQSDALEVVPFAKEFNREILTAKGLNPSKPYRLTIDGTEIGTWSGQDFASGINLAEQTRTPQYQQAIVIRHLNEERQAIEKRFRDYAYVEFSVLLPKELLFKDDLATLDTLKSMAHRNEAFMRGGNFDNYVLARHKEVREAWQKEMDVLVDKIYSINKPVKRKVTIELAQ